MWEYLVATGRGRIADLADKYYNCLVEDTDTRYDKLIEIDLSSLEPMLNGPFTPDRANPISEIS